MAMNSLESRMEPKWLETMRTQAWQRFESLPDPSPKSELFKYGTYKDLSCDSRDLCVRASAFDKGASCLLEDGEAASMCIGDGKQLARKFQVGDLEDQGFIFCDLSTAIIEYPDLLKKYMDLPTTFSDDKFAQLAVARWTNGLFVYVPETAAVDGILRASQFFHQETPYCHRTLVIVGQSAKLTLVEEYFSADIEDTNMTSGLVDIILEEDAELEYVRTQSWGAQTQHFLRERFYLSRGAKMKFTTINIGGSKGQELLAAQMAGEGAELDVMGATRADKDQHLDFVANFYHEASHTRSALDHWVVAADRSRCVFNGLVHVAPTALHTDAYQKNRCLLLSPNASVHSMPKLIIETDEVTVAHGASIAPVDPEQLFYLESRGMDPEMARIMLVDGFTAPVLDALPGERLSEKFRNWFHQKGLGVE